MPIAVFHIFQRWIFNHVSVSYVNTTNGQLQTVEDDTTITEVSMDFKFSEFIQFQGAKEAVRISRPSKTAYNKRYLVGRGFAPGEKSSPLKQKLGC